MEMENISKSKTIETPIEKIEETKVDTENNKIIISKYKDFVKTNNLFLNGESLTKFLNENQDIAGNEANKIIKVREMLTEGVMEDFEKQQVELEAHKKEFMDGLKEAREKDIKKAEDLREEILKKF